MFFRAQINPASIILVRMCVQMNVERAHLEGVMRELGDLLGLQPHEARKLIIKNTTLVRDCIFTMPAL